MDRNRIAKSVLLILIALLTGTSGCAVMIEEGDGATTIAESDRQSLEQEFEPGVTTWREVSQKLGMPTRKAELAGHDVWEYHYQKDVNIVLLWFISEGGEDKKAVFFFDPDSGILERMDYREMKE